MRWVAGDNWTTARIVAARLGIAHVAAEVLPAGKADQVCSLLVMFLLVCHRFEFGPHGLL